MARAPIIYEDQTTVDGSKFRETERLRPQVQSNQARWFGHGVKGLKSQFQNAKPNFNTQDSKCTRPDEPHRQLVGVAGEMNRGLRGPNSPLNDAISLQFLKQGGNSSLHHHDRGNRE